MRHEGWLASDLFLLESHVPGQRYGGLSEGTLAWLEEGLAGEPSRPALLFLHHPPCVAGIWHMDCQNLTNAAALAEIRAMIGTETRRVIRQLESGLQAATSEEAAVRRMIEEVEGEVGAKENAEVRLR